MRRLSLSAARNGRPRASPGFGRLVWVVPLILSMSGCAALSKFFRGAFKQPSLNFRSAELQNASLSDATMNLVWELRNPNPINLNLAELSYNFQVEGKQVVAGTPPNGLAVKGNGASLLVFPANIKFQDIVPVIQTFLTKDFANYRAEGHVGIKTPIGVLRFPLSKDGQFEVPKIPQIQLAAPRITGLTFSNATLEVPVTVTNRNSYNLPINQVTGGLSIAGANVGSLTTGDLGQLEGKATKTINLPITVNFASALPAANAIRSGSANIAWNGNVQSGSASIPVNFQQNLSFRR